MDIRYKILDTCNRLFLRGARKSAKPYKTSDSNRDEWVRDKLEKIKPGSRLLDVGAGECRYKPICNHLEYVSQDIAQYDGKGDGKGLQTGQWDFSKIDIVCDIPEIPETEPFDSILCTEVLEHVPDAPASLRKFSRLLKPGGQLILTAPFACLVHFAPHFFSSGYSEYFYRKNLEEYGFEIDEITPNGSYFRQLHTEINRVLHMASSFTSQPLTANQVKSLSDAAQAMRELIDIEENEISGIQSVPSAALSSYGFFVSAKLGR